MYHLCTVSLLSFFFPFSLAHNEKHFFYKNDYDANTSIKKKQKKVVRIGNLLCNIVTSMDRLPTPFIDCYDDSILR